MRIAVLDVAASVGGVATVLRSFHKFVLEHGRAHEWTFFVSTVELESAPHVRVVATPYTKKNWGVRLFHDYCVQPRLLRQSGAEVVLSLQDMIAHRFRGRQVLFLQQPIPFQTLKRYSFVRGGERKMAVYQHVLGRMIKADCRRADLVITQTNCMAEAVERMARVPKERLAVLSTDVDVRGAASCAFVPGKPVTTRTFVYPAAGYPYKNHTCAVQAARLLVQRGHTDFRVVFTRDESQRDAFGAQGLPQVEFVGTLPRADVLRMYVQDVLLFPSYIESGSLPLLEARRLGGVEIVADVAYARELLCGYPNAYFFPPFDPTALADLMQRVLNGALPYQSAQPEDEKALNGWAQMLQLLETLQ